MGSPHKHLKERLREHTARRWLSTNQSRLSPELNLPPSWSQTPRPPEPQEINNSYLRPLRILLQQPKLPKTVTFLNWSYTEPRCSIQVLYHEGRQHLRYNLIIQSLLGDQAVCGTWLVIVWFLSLPHSAFSPTSLTVFSSYVSLNKPLAPHHCPGCASGRIHLTQHMITELTVFSVSTCEIFLLGTLKSIRYTQRKVHYVLMIILNFMNVF